MTTIDRARYWSITINNPTEEEYKFPLPAKWKLNGQLERGEDTGTLHYQGMLNTAETVRFSAVKKAFPRAHIEAAKNPAALAKYVQKEETRVSEVDSIPTLFQYQRIIADAWDEESFQKMLGENPTLPQGDVAMRYVDQLVAEDITSCLRRGAEFIGINPMWRSSWKLFFRAIITRRDGEWARAQNQAIHETPASGTDGPQASDSQSCEERG